MPEIVLDIRSSILVAPFEELPDVDRRLIFFARNTRLNSQSPYSNFKVGAAVLDINGNISCGVNVERCTYTQTTHAEQNAIDNMVTTYGPLSIETMAIDASSSELILSLDKIDLSDIIFPCGHCLQIIWENCLSSEVIILSYLGSDLVAKATIGTLFPVRFGPNNLNIKAGSEKNE